VEAETPKTAHAFFCDTYI